MPNYWITEGSYTQIVGHETKVFVASTSNNVVELTEETAKRLGPTFVPVDDKSDRKVKSSNVVYTEFLGQSVELIHHFLSTMHDPVVLAEIHAVETENEARPEVLDAIDARYDELQEEHSKA